jgi:hypothetical protein
MTTSRRPWRLTTPPAIEPLPEGKQLAPYSVPSPPAGKFRDIPGQLAMDIYSDDPDALIDPAGPPCIHCDGTGHCPLPACSRCSAGAVPAPAGWSCAGCNGTGKRAAA